MAVAPTPDIPDQDLQRLFGTMLLARVADDCVLERQRHGELGFYLPGAGEEAVHLAVYPLRASDWVFPSPREAGAWFWRGHSLADFAGQLFGTTADPLGGRQMPAHRADRARHMASVSAPLGTQIPHAVGAAHAAKIQQTGAVSMAFFGLGAVASGDFHTGLNFAGVYRVPVVFVCRHQLGGRGPHLAGLDRDRGLAARARAYGIAHSRADGSDLLAVIAAARAAVERARAGDGATLVELMLDPSGAEPDPLVHLREHLKTRDLWTQADEDARIEAHRHELEQALDRAQSAPPPAPETLLDHVYEHLPQHLRAARRQLAARAELAAGRPAHGS